MNKIILIGRLVADPELRYTQSGIPVCNFRLAVDRPYTNQSGEREADFIDVVVWRKTAENVAKFMSKGRQVAVEGALQIRSYEDNNGIRRRIAEVQANSVEFLGGGGRAQQEDGFSQGASQDNFSAPQRPAAPQGGFGEEVTFDDDDLPF
ncbi:single-stranded DNA-binding protein [Peptococcus niger]|uniref:Single-stranded DNA-binding protein n=1 Tax=Peptococcus niger TaxID=2741 RepID=A0A1G7AEL3_PEPNI|nr:single-stranded DNA-binding protein [Peptococcus niger]SDE13261.1 single-strand binding protein [Peptococcus niger]